MNQKIAQLALGWTERACLQRQTASCITDQALADRMWAMSLTLDECARELAKLMEEEEDV